MPRKPSNLNRYLATRYYDPSKPGAFTSPTKLYKTIKREGRYDVSFKDIQDWAASQDTITLNTRPIQKTTPKRKVVTGLKDCLWDCDLLQLDGVRFSSANGGMTFILVCVDILSRYAYAQPIKNKGAKEVLRAFETIFDRAKQQPKSLRCDNGKEFTNRTVQAYMEQKGVHLYFTKASTKANYAEIFIKTLKRRLFRLFQHRSTYAYVDKLDAILASYNNTLHSSIDMAPSQVQGTDQQELWNRIYYPPKAYREAFIKARQRTTRARPKTPFRFNVGDTVRISYLRQAFTRDYDEKYSGEVFTVRRRRLAKGIPIYFLTDYSGEPVEGAFYQWEIKRVIFDPNSHFKIDKILKKRRHKGRQQSLVQFQSWPKKYNQWLDDKDIKRL